jgi:hypothetical protein
VKFLYLSVYYYGYSLIYGSLIPDVKLENKFSYFLDSLPSINFCLSINTVYSLCFYAVPPFCSVWDPFLLIYWLIFTAFSILNFPMYVDILQFLRIKKLHQRLPLLLSANSDTQLFCRMMANKMYS